MKEILGDQLSYVQSGDEVHKDVINIGEASLLLVKPQFS